ncbi:hypothetical protein K435DRAFT_804322 [Dendrothele bispora CBS 962.96]|uniref:Uncharacterized protein n=1 Tax=Dendrothele bispora (strain CBS 962.96) TaxID=1314807 RepID=A0A4S8LET7_DENBC|nr:hypothetical protein K435DRAFT_804322 [Dendrothele bispora CBS 962.96]
MAIVDPAIHAAVSIAKKTLNRYYNKTDHSKVYRIAMKWIDAASGICREEFKRKYKGKFEVEAEEVSHPKELLNKKQSTNRFDKLLSLAPPKKTVLRDELD